MSEPLATHARRRLRLTPSQNPDPSLPQPDPCLWIMHYCQTEPQHRFPTKSIQSSEPVRRLLSERASLQRHGQLVRKEFMLRDSASWPTINLPGNTTSAYPQQAMGYPNDVMAHMNRSQQQAYIQQQQANASQRNPGPSPAKRPRHSSTTHGHASATAIPAPVVAQAPTNEEEDGTIGGDYMDYLTPRDISLHRYIQHHEWIEQILESPYDTDQIIPGDLGLGRKGELESLTRDFFEAPTEGTRKEVFPVKDPPPKDYSPPVPAPVGKLEAGKADEFTKRATEKVAHINAEMEKMKKQHAKRMAKLEKGRALKEAEEGLRKESLEFLNGTSSKASNDLNGDLNSIALKVFGKGVEVLQDIECIQKGGLEEKSENQEINDQDYDMVDNPNVNGTMENQLSAPSEAAAHREPSNEKDSTPQASHPQTSESEAVNSNDDQSGEGPSAVAPRKDSAAEDWIMVNKDENTAPADQGEDLVDLDSFVNDAAMQSGIAMDEAVDNQPQEFNQSTDNTGPFASRAEREQPAGAFEPNEFGESIDFGDMDTAENELADFAEGIQNPDLGAGDLEANDGAFADAFQATEPSDQNETSGA